MLGAISDSLVLQRWWLGTVLMLGLLLAARLMAKRPRATWMAWIDSLLVLALAALTGGAYFAGDAPAADDAAAAAPAVLSAAQIAAGAFVQLQMGFCLVIFLLVTKRPPVPFLGLQQQGAWRVLGQALMGLIATLLVMNGADYALHHWVLHTAAPEQSDQAIVHTFLQTESATTRAVLIVSACVVAPMMEELMYRGLMFGLARHIIGTRVAAVLAAALFALAHADAVAALPLFLLALGFTTMYARTGSLLVPVVMHALFNALNLWQMSQ